MKQLKKKKRRKGPQNTIAMEIYDFLEQNYADKDLSIRDLRRILREVIDRLDFYEILQEISETDTIIIHPFEKGYKERIFGNRKREG